MAIDLVGPANWAAYEDLMRNAHETFGKQVITWRKSLGGLDEHGEDNLSERFEDRDLEVLLNYNVFRTWPINRQSESGMVDNQTVAVIVNRRYLSENSWLTPEGNFAFSPTADRFIINGLTYSSKGDTQSSQGHSDPIWYQFILQRENPETSNGILP